MQKTHSVPTLEDVARVAGVSTATVSRSLNTPERVETKTRTRVMEVIEELGYTPNFAARVMAAKRSFTIGAIIPTMDNAIFARGIQAFQEELYQRGFVLLVSCFLYDPKIERDQIRTMVARGADGLLLIGHDRDPGIYDYLENQKVPALVSWTYEENAPRPSVGFDNRTAMEALTQQVIQMGHTNLCAIMGNSQDNDRVRQRIAGIQDALSKHDLNGDSLKIIETSHNVNSGGDAFEQIMAMAQKPTAVLCGNDVLAVGAIKRAKQLGVKIPHDVSITGFDDIELASIVDPALTTVHVPHREMGTSAARALVDMIEGTQDAGSVHLRTEIQMRGSLGPPRPKQ